MKTDKDFEQNVYGYWAQRFGCRPEEFSRPGERIVLEEDLSVLAIYQVGEMSILRAAPSSLRSLGLTPDPDEDAVSRLRSMLADDPRVSLEAKGFFFYLAPQEFLPFTVAEDLVTRRVYPEQENERLLELYGACTDEEIDDAEIYVDEPDPVIYGIFDGPRLVAYASHRYWHDILADIGVLVHPEYRSRGLGKGVVSALCAWCIDNEIVPMYRVSEDHDRSRRIPEALGFCRMADVMVVRAELE